MSAEPTGKRLGGLGFVAVMVFGSLIARLWFLQVMSVEKFEAQTQGNTLRTIYVESPRGRIIDAKGRVLADRRESLVVTLDWSLLQDFDKEERAVLFSQVADALNREGIKTKVPTLEADFGRAKNGSLKPVVVAEDIDVRTWVNVSEANIAGFQVERRWVRSYPYGEVGAHMLGYTGVVSDQDHAVALNGDDGAQHYEAGDEIGVQGLEVIFESVLRGIPEKREVEIDARNRVIRTTQILQPGSPGQDIFLTIDIDLQYAAELIIEDELRNARNRQACETCTEPHVAPAGSLVALDVTDGSVIALASYPSFDPADFVFGISSEQFGFLRDRSDRPLYDRAVRGTYPAGSIFKPVTAYAALLNGVRGEYTPWEDEGFFILESCVNEDGEGCRSQNAGGAILGTVDMRAAITQSSDTYFYSLGEQFWIKPDLYGANSIQEVAVQMGYGEATGIRLPLEAAGRVPTEEGLREEFGEDTPPWRTGDNVNLAIGQGDLLVSPLQIANAYAMLATGGDRFQPRLVERAADSDGNTTIEYQVVQLAEKDLDPVLLQPIMDGLYNVPVAAKKGTAVQAFDGFPLNNYPLGGKTGTVQKKGQADFSLYVGFGPRTNPKYSVAVVLEEAGFGGSAAAPAVRRFYEILLGLAEGPVAPIVHEDRYQSTIPTVDQPTALVEEIADDLPADGTSENEQVSADDSTEGSADDAGRSDESISDRSTNDESGSNDDPSVGIESNPDLVKPNEEEEQP